MCSFLIKKHKGGCLLAQYIKKKKGWGVRFYINEIDELGKRKRIYLGGFRTKKEAETAMLDHLNNIKQYGHTINQDLTLKEYLEYFFENYVATNTAPRTQLFYADIYRLHIIPYLGSIKISMLQPSHLQSYYTHLLNEKQLSKATVKKHHRALHLAFKHAVKWGMLYRNVTEAVDPPRPDRQVRKVLNKTQLNQFLEKTKGTSVYIPYILLITTGMRRGEVCGLQDSNVNLDTGMIYIRTTLQRYNGKLNLTVTKNHRSERPIALLPEVIPILKQYMTLKQRLKRELGEKWCNNDFFCVWLDDGREIKPEYLSRTFKKIMKELGFDSQLSLHDLRHSHATILMEEGKHPKIVQERLGHTTIKTTMDTYSHVSPSLEKKEMQDVKILDIGDDL